MSDIKALLTGTPISAILPNRPLVYLGHHASIGDVLELLSSHGILSAPVFTANADGVVENPSIGTLLGFVDVWAVLVAFLQSLPAGRFSNPPEQSTFSARGSIAAAAMTLLHHPIFSATCFATAVLAASTVPKVWHWITCHAYLSAGFHTPHMVLYAHLCNS
jgi:hypothetical protein